METQEFKAEAHGTEKIDIEEVLKGQDEKVVDIGKAESEQIDAFQKEMTSLCEKYGIVAVIAGTRRQRQIDEKRTICPGFITSIVSKPTAKEARTIVRSYVECQNVIARLAIR